MTEQLLLSSIISEAIDRASGFPEEIENALVLLCPWSQFVGSGSVERRLSRDICSVREVETLLKALYLHSSQFGSRCSCFRYSSWGIVGVGQFWRRSYNRWWRRSWWPPNVRHRTPIGCSVDSGFAKHFSSRIADGGAGRRDGFMRGKPKWMMGIA